MNRLWNCTIPIFRQNIIQNSSIRSKHFLSGTNTWSKIRSPQCKLLQLQLQKIIKTTPANSLQTYQLITRFFHSSKSIFASGGGQTLSSNTSNINLVKDVMLFKYENPKYFRYLNIFAYCQFLFWTYLSHFAYTELRDTPRIDDGIQNEQLSWYQKINLGEQRYRMAITIFCFGVGYGILCMAWLFTLRSVKFLVLRKGGEKISFVTYTPFGQNRMMDVPMKCISAQDSRQTARSLLPIKLQGRRLYYILDMRGEFPNGKLFDHTAGLKRKLP